MGGKKKSKKTNQTAASVVPVGGIQITDNRKKRKPAECVDKDSSQSQTSPSKSKSAKPMSQKKNGLNTNKQSTNCHLKADSVPSKTVKSECSSVTADPNTDFVAPSNTVDEQKLVHNETRNLKQNEAVVPKSDSIEAMKLKNLDISKESSSSSDDDWEKNEQVGLKESDHAQSVSENRSNQQNNLWFDNENQLSHSNKTGKPSRFNKSETEREGNMRLQTPRSKDGNFSNSHETSNKSRRLNNSGTSKVVDWRNSKLQSDETVKDAEYYNFTKLLKTTGDYKYVIVQEKFGDLFEMSEEYALAHCVAEDMSMGSGIAVTFRQVFKKVDELLHQRITTGGVAILEIKGRYIYYLVTKKHSTKKPTLYTLWSSVQKMKKHIQEHGVTKLAIPRIGCGLDRLEWSDVKFLLEYTFKDIGTEIVVCNFQQSEDNTASPKPAKVRNCLVVHEKYPIRDIDDYTIIIYLGSEDGATDDIIESLDSKFNIIMQYKRENKKMGQVIFHTNTNGNYYVCGFIVKQKKGDWLNYINLQECVAAVEKQNRKLKYEYVGIQAFQDQDPLVMDKVINILRNSLRHVSVYVCWPSDLQHLMPDDRRNDY